MINVYYEAPNQIARPRLLEELLQQQVRRHLRTVERYVSGNPRLDIRVRKFEAQEEYGRVAMSVTGEVNSTPFILYVDRADKPRPPSPESNDASRRIFAHFFTYLVRLFFPTGLARAIGGPWRNAYAIRACRECVADLRVAIDSAVGRPPSEGAVALTRSLRNGAALGLLALLAATATYLLRREWVADEFRAIIGCGFCGVGVGGAVASWGLLRLPRQFYLSEPKGRRLMKLFGVTHLASVRVTAAGLAVFCCLMTAAGVYWIVFE